jgi:hypothetical protein
MAMFVARLEDFDDLAVIIIVRLATSGNCFRAQMSFNEGFGWIAIACFLHVTT